MPVIYIDVLVILNLWVDFLLLSATARLRRLPVKRWRMLCGAAAGSAGSCLLFLPPLHWTVALLLRLAGTVLLTLLVFSYRSRTAFWRTLLTFFLLSAAFAGLSTLLWYTLAPAGFIVVNGVPYYDAPAALLIVFTGISYVAVCAVEYAMRKRAPKNRQYTLLLKDGEKTLVCPCLYDTGSTLREPFSGRPAVLIDRAAAGDFLPFDPEEVLRQPDTAAVRFVPFDSLGGSGLLPAFLPMRMEISDRDGRIQDITGSYLAVCENLGHGEYTALVGTDIGDLLTEGNE